jgi:thioredoxin reductase
MKRKVIIIGGGPAGISCAIQLKRQGLDPLIFEKEDLGGLLWNASTIENYPGFPAGIQSEQLIDRMIRHLESWKVDIIYEEVLKISWDEQMGFNLNTGKSSYYADQVVVASGTEHKTSAFATSNLTELILYDVKKLKGISSKIIGIIGAGDAAFDYALNLASRSNIVKIFNRSNRIKALPLLASRAFKEDSIEYYENHQLKSVKGPVTSPQMKLVFLVDNSEQEYQSDYLIFATGRNPAAGFIDVSVDANRENLLADRKLFFIGDVAGGRYRQTAIAVGEGIKTAMIIFHEGNKTNNT